MLLEVPAGPLTNIMRVSLFIAKSINAFCLSVHFKDLTLKESLIFSL